MELYNLMSFIFVKINKTDRNSCYNYIHKIRGVNLEVQSLEKIKEYLTFFKDFFGAATDFNRRSREIMVKEAHDVMDEFILLCYGDLLGIPIPTTYYSLEILPLIAEDLEGWQFRMISKMYIWQQKWADYGFDA